MRAYSAILPLLFLYSSVSSHNQEKYVPYFNEDFMTEFKPENIYFLETFNSNESFFSTFTVSKSLKAMNEDGGELQYDGDWVLEEAVKDALPNDLGLTFKEKAKHRAISSKLNRDFIFHDKPFILQYEVLYQEGQECGGAYLKLISKQKPVNSLSDFNDKTPYTIMFGPDKCGAVNKIHFIFRHKNPISGSFEEKHCKPSKSKIDELFTDGKPHLLKLVVNPDNTFAISLDNKVINEGSLLEDFDPPVNPPSEIDDPTNIKPSDWDDREKIYDPAAHKPEDWDESAPYQIPDPSAVKPDDWFEDEPVNIRDPSADKPEDWDNEMDGEWEAPLVPNPACEEVSGCGKWSPPLINNADYKGKWIPPLIDNPNYRGIWKPNKIPNPDYFEDNEPFKMSAIDSLGFELWSMSTKIMFDNILLTNDENIAKEFAEWTFNRKISKIENSAGTLWVKMMISLNHKPGWWLLYFLYCSVPIAIYVWYLWRRVIEDTLLNQFIAFTNQYPWLWALYIVILLIPITSIVICCFWTTKDTDAEHKKDDDKIKKTELYASSNNPLPSVDEDKNINAQIEEDIPKKKIILNDPLVLKQVSESTNTHDIKNKEDELFENTDEVPSLETEHQLDTTLKQRKQHSN